MKRCLLSESYKNRYDVFCRIIINEPKADVSLRVLKVASQYKDHSLHFSVANRHDFIDELEEEFGLGTTEVSDMPFITIRTRLGHKYTMREEFT